MSEVPLQAAWVDLVARPVGMNLLASSFSLLISSLELSDTNIYEPSEPLQIYKQLVCTQVYSDD